MIRIGGRRVHPKDVLLWIVGMAVAVAWILPFVWMVSTSLKPESQIVTKTVEWLPREVVLDNYLEVFKHPIGAWALNSFLVSTTATFFGVWFGAMAGYALARLSFPGRGLIFALLIASLMVPAEITVVPLYIGFLTTGLTDNLVSVALPSVASVITVYIFRQFFLSMPQEIEDSAAIDGAGRLGTFFRIAWPLAKAPTIAATILLLTANWNAYLWPSLVTLTESVKTLPVGIAAFSPAVGTYTQYASFGPAMAAITILSLPGLLAFILLQRYFVEGVSRAGIHG